MSNNTANPVRIGCYSAFWGDSALAASQLIQMDNPPDYVVADYLAEVTMGILARSKVAGSSKKPKGVGFVKEFVDQVYTPNAQTIADKRITLITNAGGLDPVAAKLAIEAAAKAADISPLPVVAAVYGDDLLAGDAAKEIQRLRQAGEVKPFGHLDESSDGEVEKWPEGKKPILSVNIYMGCEAIVKALNAGANIIVTGRVVDSAIVVAPLIHRFGWRADAWDLLAAGSLAGHIIECGCHATGGNFTDWRLSAFTDGGGWSNMGYPIVEVSADGSFVVTKPPNTGGLVSVHTVTEQMIYEVLDPGSYLLPDVTLDMRYVSLKQVGPNRVLVQGAKGRPPTPYLKTSGVFVDGYKMSGELLIGGEESAHKAKAVGEAIVKRVRSVYERLGIEDFRDYLIECLGSEQIYGPHGRGSSTRETVLRMTVHHDNKMGLLVFARETAPAATCMAPGITGGGSGRPSPAPNLNHFSLLVPRGSFPAYVEVGPDAKALTVPYSNVVDPNAIRPPPLAVQVPRFVLSEPTTKVPLIWLCLGRSGDKGDTANIGVIARRPEYYPFIASVVTTEKVKEYMKHLVRGRVERYLAPGSYCLNFVCLKALGGGGLTSLRIDRQGKTYAQVLLSMTVDAPASFNLAPPEGVYAKL
ncbi:hypothetical protein DFJ73DRAFT_661552 [Zopfochytrium polystomum]|nr:hypothetical protein DFJ73DRAFT_661552 [Zopfochytrium polystomum]